MYFQTRRRYETQSISASHHLLPTLIPTMESGMPEPVTAATMRLPDFAAIEAAANLIRPVVPPTPQILWPLLSRRAGAVGEARESYAHWRLQDPRRPRLHARAEAPRAQRHGCHR